MSYIKSKFVNYSLVHLIFDQYDKEFMNNSRAKRYNGKSVGSIYMSDSTDISKTTKVNIQQDLLQIT